MSTADLLLLQGKCKTDPESYRDEFLMRLRHYRSLLGIFSLTPNKDHKEFSDLVGFLAQVSASYPKDLTSLPKELVDLLETNHAVLDPSLRRTIAQALILLKNRGAVETSQLVPLFFRLFRVNDKTLRQLLFRHIVTDIKTANKKRKADQLNRAVQGYLHTIVLDEHVRTAKRAVALLAELYRRNVWSDPNTVNILAAAVFHKNAAVMVSALKFFSGQDENDEEGDDDDDDSDGEGRTAAGKRRSAEAMGAVGLSREDVYKAYSKGTTSSKKKKQAKLKREIVKVRRKAKREEDGAGEAKFSAIMLLHDPQGFAEKLFGRIHSGGSDSWETKLLSLQVLSRLIGMHKLQVLNFYPLLQRYVQPQQRDATRILACAAQACHDQVPPDAMEPLVRQVVNAFVHDRARPEVMAVGLSAVREIAVRAPLVMTPELLQDLAMYKRNKDKAVATASRSVVMLFRELAPGLLAKKDRGKGHVKERTVPEYGASNVSGRVEGAELLEAALLRGDASGSDGDDDDGEGGSRDEGASGSGSDGEGSEDDEDGDEGEEGSDGEADMEGIAEGDGEESDEDGGEDEEEEEAEAGANGGKKKGVKRGRESADADEEEEERKAKKPATEGSLRQLKKAALAAKAEDPSAPKIEQERMLGPEDFERIKALKAEALMKTALAKYGAKSAAHKGAAEVAAALSRHASTQHQKRVNPDSLHGTHKVHSDKSERMASIMAGREGREAFGSSVARKKKKLGGLSNKEKEKRKSLPVAAVQSQARKRFQHSQSVRRTPKNFSGRKAWKT